jgi:hypothetical protein
MQTNAHRAAALIAASITAFAYAQPNYSNTLGSPGFTGSYVAAFAGFDDGTGSSLYATGSFSAAGVPGSSLIARWDGGAWNAVGGGLQNQFSNTLAVFGNQLIVGGYFDSAGGVAGTEKLAAWDGNAWHSMNAQSSSFLNSIWDLQVHDDGSGEALYIGGNYLDLSGNPALDHIARWDGTTYSPVGGTIGGAVPLIVLDLLSADIGNGSRLFAAGRFLTFGGVAALNIAQWDGTNWAPVGGGLSRTSGLAQVFHMVAWDDGNGMALYAGGSFNRADGTTVVSNIAKWDGTAWSAMGDGFDAGVQELIVFDDGTGEALYAMGNFTLSGTASIDHVAKWNGSDWEAVGLGANDSVFGGIVYDAGEGQALIMGGSFTQAGGLSSNRVVSILAAACAADFTNDGVLDFFDVAAFLSAFSDQDASADFTDDSIWDFFDVAAFLDAFSAGCP